MPQTLTKTGKKSAGKSSRNTSSTSGMRTTNTTKTKTANASRSSQSNAGQEDHTLLGKFLLDAIKDIYWAEKHLTKVLPKMKKAATSEELKGAFDEHLAVTEEHVKRLEQVFEAMGKKAQGKKCDAMEGLVKEAESIIEETEAGTATRDVALIIAAQKVEHYEIASYGGIVQLAKVLGYEDAAELLAQTLAEEKEADEKLTSIAENDINLQAREEGEGEEE